MLGAVCTGIAVTEAMQANSRRQQALYAAAMAAAIVCNVMLFAPFTLYTGNPDEFSVSLPAILTVYAPPAMLVVVAVGTIGAFFPVNGYPRFLAFLAAFPILMWIQGTILVWDYGVLDGSPVPWLEMGWLGAIDTTVWIGVLLIALYGYRRVGKLLVQVAAVTFVIQLLAIGASVIAQPVASTNVADNVFDEAQYRAMYGFSGEKNVFHVVMDGFQSDIFASIINDPENKELRDALSGFTFFDQHAGTFPYTQMTIPLIVSGKTYLNHMPVDEFAEQAMQENSVLNLAEAAGYEVDIAAQVALRKAYTKGSFTNTYDIPKNRHTSPRDYIVSDAVRMLDLALFRLTPHFVKAYIYEDGLWFVQPRFRDADYLSIRYFSELDFLKYFAESVNANREKPVYKLFHLMLSHRPTVGNEQCKYDGIRETTRINVTIQARCGLAHVVEVLNAMKEIDVYDDSLIVLMADHGAWVGPSEYTAERNRKRIPDGGPRPAMVGLAVPMLAIKPAGSDGPLAVSSAPTTIADVPATIASLLGLEPKFDGRNAFEISVSETRPRTFFDYAY